MKLNGSDYTVLWSLRNLPDYGTPSTPKGIAYYLAWPIDDILDCLSRLVRSKMAYNDNGQYYLTTLADQILESAVDYPELVSPTELARYRSEVLTGTGTHENAVLPSGKRAKGSNGVEYALVHAMAMRRIASRVGLSAVETIEAIESGKIRYCPKCRQHNVFYRNSSRKNGFAAVCRDCARQTKNQ